MSKTKTRTKKPRTARAAPLDYLTDEPGVPEDEMTVAVLIAAAGAHGLAGCRGANFQDASGETLEFDRYATTPPAEATCCCALGAQRLVGAGAIRKPITSFHGNDARAGEVMMPWCSDIVAREWGVGAVFNIAMMPDSE